MAKGFRIPTVVRGKEPILRQTICEVRYRDGYLYLDHCGRLLNRLMKEAPEWVVAPQPNPQGTTLHNPQTGTRLAFSTLSASLQLDKTSTDEVIDEEDQAAFLGQLEGALAMVLDELEVTEFRRVGYRQFYHFPFDSKEDSEKWLQELGLVTVAPGLLEAFVADHDAMGLAFVLRGEDCRYRVGLNGVERPAQIPVGDALLTIRPSAAPKNQRHLLIETLKKKRQRQINSAFMVVLDIDAFLEELEGEVDLRSFVEEHTQQDLQRFQKSLPQEQRKKGK